MGQPPRTGVEPRPGGASTGRVAGRRHQGHGRPGPPRGATHARPPGGYPGGGPTGTAEPTVGGLHVQPAGRAHRRLRPRAPAGARSCGPRGGLYLHDRQGATGGRTPRPPAPGPAEGQRTGGEAGAVAGSGAHTDLELQLAVPTTVYHWLQAFHDLQWRGKPDRQIGSTHSQAWLPADAQRDAVRSLGPAPATRALDAAAPGRALAPHTVPMANLPFEPATEGAIRKLVPLSPARGSTEPTKCPLCADKYYTSGAMLEHLAWHAVHAAAPVDDKEAASNILQWRARRSPWHAPYARRPPPQAADHADGDEEAPGAAPGTGGAAQQRSIPAGLASPAPLWAPGNGLSAPHGPGAPGSPGCPSGPSGDADAGRLTPGGHGGRCPMAPLVEPAQRPCTARPVPPGHAPAAPGAGSLYRHGAPHHRHATPGGGLCHHAPGNRDRHPGAGDARGCGAPGQGVHPLLQQPAGGDGSHFHLERGGPPHRGQQ